MIVCMQYTLHMSCLPLPIGIVTSGRTLDHKSCVAKFHLLIPVSKYIKIFKLNYTIHLRTYAGVGSGMVISSIQNMKTVIVYLY